MVHSYVREKSLHTKNQGINVWEPDRYQCSFGHFLSGTFWAIVSPPINQSSNANSATQKLNYVLCIRYTVWVYVYLYLQRSKSAEVYNTENVLKFPFSVFSVRVLGFNPYTFPGMRCSNTRTYCTCTHSTLQAISNMNNELLSIFHHVFWNLKWRKNYGCILVRFICRTNYVFHFLWPKYKKASLLKFWVFGQHFLSHLYNDTTAFFLKRGHPTRPDCYVWENRKKTGNTINGQLSWRTSPKMSLEERRHRLKNSSQNVP